MEETERMNMDGQCVGMVEIRDLEKKTEEKVTSIFVFFLFDDLMLFVISMELKNCV